MESPVPWKRFWRRIDDDGEDSLSSDGFLQVWRHVFGDGSYDGLKSLDELLDLECLVLCGEPGMGKSTVLELCRPQIYRNAEQAGSIYWRSFREAFGPEHLLQDLKCSAQWTDWLAGQSLAIVIDGVDEGLALASNFLSVFVAELRSKPVERLKLILTCRDAEWPVAEGEALLKLWPADRCGRFQIQRLRVGDAEEGASHWGLSAGETEAFLTAVKEKAVEAFAARPITLRMLVEEFKADRQLSGTRLDIFRRACLRLCRENPLRAKTIKKASGFEFTGAEIVPVIRQTAALLLFGRYSGVSNPASHGCHLDLESLIPLAADNRERARVEAALASALFCDAGSQSRRFAHQTYAEFLASEYLAEFPLAQVLDLLCIHDGGQRFTVPQLAEVAAWLALQHSDFLDWLIAREPEILLRNDASCLTEQQRGRVVEALLRRIASEDASDDWSLKRFYASFCHPGLAGQLRPYLRNKASGRFARRAAVHLAGLGKLEEVLNELLTMVNDVTEDVHLREEAMKAAVRFIPIDRLAELDKFANCEGGPDPHDEIRGAALKALVPRHWKVSQALPALAKPANRNFVGEFRLVCDSHLPESISAEDVPEILEELLKIDHPFEGFDNRVRPTACKSLVLAAQHLRVPHVAAAFVKLVREKLWQRQLPFGIEDESWSELINNIPSVRHDIASSFVEASGMTPDELSQLYAYRFIPLIKHDWAWVLKRMQSSSVAVRPRWARLAGWFWANISESSDRDAYFEACESIPELAAEVRWPCTIHLGSQEEKQARDHFKMERTCAEQATEKPAKPSPDQRFQAALQDAEKDWRAWQVLSLELQRPEDGTDVLGVNLDPTTRHRWLASTPETRTALIKCARSFLLNAKPDELREKPDGDFPLEVFWALLLLKAEDGQLESAVAGKWFDALFAQPFHGAGEEQELAKLGVGLDPSRAGVCLVTRLQRTLSGKLSLASVLAGLELTWIPEFTNLLVSFVNSEGITGLALRSALEFLAHHAPGVCETWIGEKLRDSVPDLATVVSCALVLFPISFWDAATSRLALDDRLAETSLQIVADIHESSPTKALERLNEQQMGDLFLILEKAFPTAVPVQLAAERVPSREAIKKLRHAVMQRLQQLASDEACHQLLRLSEAVPHWRSTLRSHWRDARVIQLRNSWPGIPVDVILSIAAKRESRWVINADDLHELLLEAIDRFQEKLNRAEYPEIRDLWNESPALCPKDESAITQKLIRWLRDYLGPKNGIALGCQVEPSPVHETDIEVWARPGGSKPTGESFVVVIEVKCSFNQEVATSLEKQLAAEYLLKFNRRHGIYLVGWYRGKGWTPPKNPLRAHNWNEARDRMLELLSTSRKLHPELHLGAACLNCEFPEAFRKRT